MTESAEEKNSALAIDTVVTAAVATTALVIDTGSSDEDEVQRLLPMSGARSRLISSRCPCSSSRSCWVLRRCAFLASCVIAVLGIELGLFVHYMDKNELGGYMSSLDRLFPNAFTGQYTYIESSRYARDRLLNQDWVAANAGQVPSARAPHWKAMPLPGRTHLLLTRLLGAWSNIAESHHLPWSMMGGTLLGYLRHGDFIPHDHDIDLVIAAEVDVTRLAAALPPDMCLTSNVLGPGHVPGWPGYKVEFRAPRYPLGADMGPISPVPFMDLFLYNTSAPLSNKGAFMGASFHPDRVRRGRARPDGAAAAAATSSGSVDPYSVVSVGMVLELFVISLDAQRRRVGLGLDPPRKGDGEEGSVGGVQAASASSSSRRPAERESKPKPKRKQKRKREADDGGDRGRSRGRGRSGRAPGGGSGRGRGRGWGRGRGRGSSSSSRRRGTSRGGGRARGSSSNRGRSVSAAGGSRRGGCGGARGSRR